MGQLLKIPLYDGEDVHTKDFKVKVLIKKMQKEDIQCGAFISLFSALSDFLMDCPGVISATFRELNRESE